MGDQTVGLQARMMSQAMRKIAGNLNRTQTLCIFTNQIREKIGVMFGSPETQPGGRCAEVLLVATPGHPAASRPSRRATEAVGNRVRVKVVKNKVAPPVPPGGSSTSSSARASPRGLPDRRSASRTTSSPSPARSSPTGRTGWARAPQQRQGVHQREPGDRQGDRGQDLRGAMEVDRDELVKPIAPDVVRLIPRLWPQQRPRTTRLAA